MLADRTVTAVFEPVPSATLDMCEPGCSLTGGRFGQGFLKVVRGVHVSWAVTLKRPGFDGGSDEPPVWWSRVAGIGHAPEMNETPRCHAHTPPSFVAASSI
jgi:hypothetical protein